jgi:hypothetical protein
MALLSIRMSASLLVAALFFTAGDLRHLPLKNLKYQ